MAAKPKDKKQLAKEEEERRLAEEARLAEEQRLREKEEARKREALQLPTGLTLYLNEYCLQEGWKHPKPKEFFFEFISRILKEKDVLDNFEKQELELIAEFHLYNLIYAKEELQLDDQKTLVFLNLMWLLFTNKNPLYEKKFDMGQYEGERKEKLLRDKTLDGDLADFKNAVMNHCIDNPPSQVQYFDPGQAKRILDYAKKGYFNHFTLYKFFLLNRQRDQDVKITIYVDTPLPLKPLDEGAVNNVENQEAKEDNQNELRKQAEEMKKREEEDRLQMEEILRKQKEEEENRLDPKTLSIIQAKIKETKEMFARQLEARAKDLHERIDAAINPKKAGKK